MHILLGVSGGISAYKCAELVRQLREAGFETKVVMTESAKAFVTPLTLEALSGFPVYDSLWKSPDASMPHIDLAKWADAILIAPATADCIARLAQGLADDLLTTLCLASTAPLIIAPGMNQAMWHHPATQANVNLLYQRNVIFFGPENGIQACGDIGLGRMQEPENIVKSLQMQFQVSPVLKDKIIMITAGPTQESIDPVRFISNHSSGKMGYALATAAKKLGAKVILISGPTHLNCPQGIERILIKTAEEMQQAVMRNIHLVNIFIGTAAVADYRPEKISHQKIKKQNADKLTLTLVKNPDILKDVAALNPKPFTVGFAAETENLLDYAEQKRIQKNLDMIIANSVSSSESGFDCDNNQGWILTENNAIELPLMSKKIMAEKILEAIASVIQ